MPELEEEGSRSRSIDSMWYFYQNNHIEQNMNFFIVTIILIIARVNKYV